MPPRSLKTLHGTKDMMQPCPVYLQCHLFGDLARNQRHDATLSRLPAMSSLWRPCTGKTRGEPQSLCKMQAQTDADIRRLVLRRLLIALPRLSLGAVPPAKVHSAAGGRAAEGKGQWRGGGARGNGEEGGQRAVARGGMGGSGTRCNGAGGGGNGPAAGGGEQRRKVVHAAGNHLRPD